MRLGAQTSAAESAAAWATVGNTRIADTVVATMINRNFIVWAPLSKGAARVLQGVMEVSRR